MCSRLARILLSRDWSVRKVTRSTDVDTDATSSADILGHSAERKVKRKSHSFCCCGVQPLGNGQSQTHKSFERTLIYQDTSTRSANFRGNPLCQATKRHLTVKWLKTMKNEKRSEITSLFWLSCCFLVQ